MYMVLLYGIVICMVDGGNQIFEKVEPSHNWIDKIPNRFAYDKQFHPAIHMSIFRTDWDLEGCAIHLEYIGRTDCIT